MKRNIAIILVDALVAAHFAFADKSGKTVLAHTRRINRNSVGLCAYIEGFEDGLGTKLDISGAFFDLLREFYDDGYDPFSMFPGGSYNHYVLNYPIRSREALRLAKYVEEKYL